VVVRAGKKPAASGEAAFEVRVAEAAGLGAGVGRKRVTPLASGLHVRLGIRQSGLFSGKKFALR
jgi:hypothetical protein